MINLINKARSIPLDMGQSYDKKYLISTLNANAFNVCLKDRDFYNALLHSDILIPDGIGVVMASGFITGNRLKKISGYDLFIYEMEQLNESGRSCFFLGSSAYVLNLIRLRAEVDYPNVKMGFYSPPYKSVFSREDSQYMIDVVNAFSPEVLFVGMTAPKQEKWAADHFAELHTSHVCCIGAVFDFYAGTVKRAPQWMISLGLEWFYRLVREPKRLWRRYLIGNSVFLWLLFTGKLGRSL
jgi:N-acetylglucosaminyldiphosphoundecaprenol N-acetyl-beta-D-mannosaminyltransferase